MTSTSFYQTLAAALQERLDIIADHAWRDRDPAAHLEALKRVSLELAEMRTQIPPGAPPKLNHYLLQCSYAKALAVVEAHQAG
ncbi:MAG TPA: hypothetical protein VNQ90_18720 [Chthoniobacteraceae bacterium]|nr:hypothetical protein [Chthoniobacteraceae bacterium]